MASKMYDQNTLIIKATDTEDQEIFTSNKLQQMKGEMRKLRLSERKKTCRNNSHLTSKEGDTIE